MNMKFIYLIISLVFISCANQVEQEIENNDLSVNENAAEYSESVDSTDSIIHYLNFLDEID